MTKKYLVLREDIDKSDDMPISKGAATTALSGKVDKNGTDRLMTVEEGSKLAAIEAGAQVNVLEGVQFNGTDATITSKKVNVTPAAIGAAAATHTHGNADLLTGIDAAKIASVNGSTLPIEVIPKAALFDLVVVANTAARLALTTDDVQNGDVVKEEDTQLMYFVKDETKLGTEAAFEVFKAGEAASVEWTNVKNKVNASASTDGILTAANFQIFNGKQDAITSDNQLGADLIAESATRKFVSPEEKEEWSGKQDALTFDDAPTEASANPVKSAGIFTALGTKVDKVAGSSLVADTKVAGYDSHLSDATIHVTASDKTTWSGKQDAITSANKLGADLVDDSTATHKFVTAAEKTAWDNHVAITAGNPHGTTKADVGLGNCDNTSDLAKPISTATQTALDGKANVTGVTGIGKDSTGYYIEE